MTTFFEVFAMTLNFLFSHLGGFLGFIVFSVGCLMLCLGLLFALEKTHKFFYVHGYKIKPYVSKKLGLKKKSFNIG